MIVWSQGFRHLVQQQQITQNNQIDIQTNLVPNLVLKEDRVDIMQLFRNDGRKYSASESESERQGITLQQWSLQITYNIGTICHTLQMDHYYTSHHVQ